MKLALEKAQVAYDKGEIPVGALIIDDNSNILAATHNICESEQDITCHAEIMAIKEVSKKLGTKYLEGCTMFVTLEPCPMCAHAISSARIKTLIYGAVDEKSGGVENGAKIFDRSSCHHKPEVISGIMEKDCGALLTDFFSKLR